jgi:hypothetical protein
MTKEASEALLAVCTDMLRITGGSKYWTGETQTVLEKMETAVAMAGEEETDFAASLRAAHETFISQ